MQHVKQVGQMAQKQPLMNLTETFRLYWYNFLNDTDVLKFSLKCYLKLS